MAARSAPPYFQKIAEECLLRLRVPPDKSLPLPKVIPTDTIAGIQDYLPNATPILPTPAQTENQAQANRRQVLSVDVAEEWVVLPDFRGQAKRRVLEQCINLGITLQSDGSGIAVYQSPSPGTRVPAGAACSVSFAKSKPKGLPTAVEDHARDPNNKPQVSANTRP